MFISVFEDRPSRNYNNNFFQEKLYLFTDRIVNKSVFAGSDNFHSQDTTKIYIYISHAFARVSLRHVENQLSPTV